MEWRVACYYVKQWWFIHKWAFRNIMTSKCSANFHWLECILKYHVNGLEQDYNNFNALTMELLLSCTKPSMWNVAVLMMLPSNGNIFRVTDPLCGEFTGDRWIPHKMASDTDLWCFLWIALEPTVEQIIETPVILDAIALIMTSL